MEENEKEEKRDQGIIKTLASPKVLAAILDPESTTEIVQDSEEKLTKKSLNTSQNNNDIPLVMDDGEVILENDSSGLSEMMADSLELNEDGGVTEHQSENIERSIRLRDEESEDKITNESLIEESFTKGIDSTTPSSKDFKQRNTSISSKLKNKPIPKVNFIDQNKSSLSRKPGKNSYAALHSQKVKLKQSNTIVKKGKTNESKEKENHGKYEDEENKRENSSEQYDKFNESYSSFPFKRTKASTYTNYNKGLYYTVDNNSIPDFSKYVSMRSPSIAQAQMDQSFLPSFDSYLNQPYQVPYREFGLRYSNHGHQSYQTSSAMAYPGQSNGFNTFSPSQTQGYVSQSAPPGVTHYARRPLIDQVEFFPEHDYILSQSLTNSQFINPQQIYQRDSVLERKFVSEPHLSHSPQPSGENTTDRASKITSGSIASVRQPVDFKPYTLKDYRQIKNEQPDVLGSLGPDTESKDYKEKITKLNKQRQYAEIIRLEHAAKKKQWEKKAPPPPAPARQLQAEAKRQAAINYSKTVPKPKVMESRQHKGKNLQEVNDEEEEVTLLELLKMRHDKEKSEVEALRNDLTKIHT